MKLFFKRFFCAYWDAIVTSAIAIIWLFFYTKHGGIGVCPDGITYLSVAKNFITDFSVLDFRGIPMVVFPLGYSYFLSLFLWTGLDPVKIIVPVLNALLFIGLLFLSSYVFQRVKFYHSIARFLLLFFLVTSTALLEVYSMIWSETLFLFLLLLFFIKMHKYCILPSIRDLWPISILTALLFFVRFAGIACVLTGAILIMIQNSQPLKIKIRHLIYYGFISLSITAINILYNNYLSGTLTGVRQEANRTVWENLYNTAEVVEFWFPIPATTIFGALLVITIILFIVFVSFSSKIYGGSKEIKTDFIVSTFFCVYTFFIISIASISRFEILNSRLLIPAFICLPILLANASVHLIRQKNIFIRTTSVLMVFFSYGFAQYHNYKNNSFTWEGVSYAGIPGYTDDYWKFSPMIDYIEKKPTVFKKNKIFSNAIDALYFLSNTKAEPLPNKDLKKDIDIFRKNNSFYLVWFFNTDSHDIIGPEEIKKHYSIQESWQFRDGSIYYFTSLKKQ